MIINSSDEYTHKTRPGARRRRKRKRRHPLRKLLFIILLTAAVIIPGYSRFIEPYMLTETFTDYTEPRLRIPSDTESAPESGRKAAGQQISADNGSDAGSSRADVLTIAVFADTHFSEYYTPENFEDVINRINNISPDLVFFLGDLVDEYDTYSGDIKEIENCLSRIQASSGKYAVYGNHDYGGGMQFEYPGVMESGGFRLLVNESQILEEYNLCIMGIDDMLIGYGNPDAAKELNPDRTNIVICHEPDVFDMMYDCSIDLMFSGHTHGRQINLKIFDDIIQPVLGRKYIKGNFNFSNPRGTSLYVTSGIGMTKLPLRFGTLPEISIITVHASDNT